MSFLSDLGRLILCLSAKRRAGMLLLFVLQSLSALSEVASLGAIVPFLSAITNIEAVVQKPYIKALTSFLNITDNAHVIVLLASVFAATVVLANLLRFLTLRYVLTLTAAIGSDLATLMFKRTLHKPYLFFTKNNSSNIIGTMTNDLGATLNTVYNSFLILTQALVAAAIALTLLVYNAKVAAVLGAIVITGYSAIMVMVSKRLRANSQVRSDSYRDMIKAMQEGIGGIRHIMTDHTHQTFIDQYEKEDRRFRIAAAQNSFISQAPRFFVESLGVASIALITIFFVHQSGDISSIIPLLGFLGLAAYRLLPAVQQLYSSVSTITGLRVSVTRTVDMLTSNADAELALSQATVKTLPLNETLRVENLNFSYNDEPEQGQEQEQWTLQDINFSIRARQTIAFVGQTGSGKSTMADLVLGLMIPQKGALTVDGVPLDDQNIGAWHKTVSHVPQQIFLTDTTIAQNIAFGIKQNEIDYDRVKRAAQMAHIEDFILSLPGQYEEVVGERGVRISGGQRQRIGIARALYKETSLIVFDEATSALDNNTESDVMAALEGLRHKLTIILIAHRLSTVKNADNILVFERGRLVDQGTFEDLSKRSDHFRRLVETEAF